MEEGSEQVGANVELSCAVQMHLFYNKYKESEPLEQKQYFWEQNTHIHWMQTVLILRLLLLREPGSIDQNSKYEAYLGLNKSLPETTVAKISQYEKSKRN